MNLVEQLKQIPDPRSGQGQRYPFWVLLLMALLGSLYGYRGYRPLAAFCRKNADEIQQVIALDISVPRPCMSTFRRLFLPVSDEALADVFHQWCLTFMRPSPRHVGGGRRQEHSVYPQCQRHQLYENGDLVYPWLRLCDCVRLV